MIFGEALLKVSVQVSSYLTFATGHFFKLRAQIMQILTMVSSFPGELPFVTFEQLVEELPSSKSQNKDLHIS